MLEVLELQQRFGGRVVVHDLSLSVDAGEIVGLIGRNGAGKTTTMRSVMGIFPPAGGGVRWSGHAAGPADWMRFGYVPEERGLYPQMRVIDQIVYFARLHGMGAKAATIAAGKWLQQLGLDGRARDRVTVLSHGNQKRVQLAMALVPRPELLLLDEPFDGLDPSVVDSLSDILRTEAARGAAILFSSHQLDLVERLCDRIVILEGGSVVVTGTLAELRSRAPRRLRVKVATALDWAAFLPGVQVVGYDGNGALLAIEPGCDLQAVLKTAMEAGPVEHFGFESGGLAQLYRELVVGS